MTDLQQILAIENEARVKVINREGLDYSTTSMVRELATMVYHERLKNNAVKPLENLTNLKNPSLPKDAKGNGGC